MMTEPEKLKAALEHIDIQGLRGSWPSLEDANKRWQSVPMWALDAVVKAAKALRALQDNAAMSETAKTQDRPTVPVDWGDKDHIITVMTRSLLRTLVHRQDEGEPVGEILRQAMGTTSRAHAVLDAADDMRRRMVHAGALVKRPPPHGGTFLDQPTPTRPWTRDITWEQVDRCRGPWSDRAFHIDDRGLLVRTRNVRAAVKPSVYDDRGLLEGYAAEVIDKAFEREAGHGPSPPPDGGTFLEQDQPRFGWAREVTWEQLKRCNSSMTVKVTWSGQRSPIVRAMQADVAYDATWIRDVAPR